jgi:sulfonate dioxygenase
VGVPRLESDHIVAYLNELIASTNELHVSFDWGRDDVAFWDNRICVSFFLPCNLFCSGWGLKC